MTPTKTSDYSPWRAIKKLKQQSKFISPIRKPNGSWASGDKEKTETFAKYFSTVFQPNLSEITDKKVNKTDISRSSSSAIISIKALRICVVKKIVKGI